MSRNLCPYCLCPSRRGHKEACAFKNAGEFILCFNCAEVSVLGPEMELRKLTSEEMEAVRRSGLVRTLQGLIRAIRAAAFAEAPFEKRTRAGFARCERRPVKGIHSKTAGTGLGGAYDVPKVA